MSDAPVVYDLTALRQRLLSALGGRADLYPKALEAQFPRILARIVELWNTPELDHYFHELTTTDRPDRQGFPEAIALELFHLSNVHASFNLSPSANAWDWAADVEYLPRKNH